MGQLILGGVTYEIYGTRQGADAYFAAATNGPAWSAAAGNTRDRALVTAQRVFERTGWQGDPTEPIVTLPQPPTPQPVGTQPLAWPRTGLEDREGVAVDPNTIPEDVISGSYEYALELVNTPTVQSDIPGSNVKVDKVTNRVEGAVTQSLEKQFFLPTIGRVPPLPQIVFDYVGLWLDGAGGGVFAFASGTDVESEFTPEKRDFGFTRPLR